MEAAVIIGSIPLAMPGVGIRNATMSPDGQQIVVSSDRTGNQDLWVMPASGRSDASVDDRADARLAPRFSPDGTSVAFYSYRTGDRDMWIVPTAGGPAERVTADQGQIQIVGWSPDAKAIHVIDETVLRQATLRTVACDRR